MIFRKFLGFFISYISSTKQIPISNGAMMM